MKWWNCKIIIIIDSESCSAGPSHKKQEGTKGRKEEGRKPLVEVCVTSAWMHI